MPPRLARYVCGVNTPPTPQVPLHLGLIAFIAGGVVWLLKTNRMNMVLADLGLPPVPKKALPWIAAGFGMLTGIVNAVMFGATWQAAVTEVLLSTMAGGFATWGHEAGVESARDGKELGTGKPVSPPKPESDPGPGE